MYGFYKTQSDTRGRTSRLRHCHCSNHRLQAECRGHFEEQLPGSFLTLLKSTTGYRATEHWLNLNTLPDMELVLL